MRVRCKEKHVWAWDTENDWSADNTEVYLVQCAIVQGDYREMLYTTNDIVLDRVMILRNMIEKAMQKPGCTIFYCANLKHEAELLKEGLKVIQNEYSCEYLRRDSQMLQIVIHVSPQHILYLRDVLTMYAGASIKSLGKLFNLPKLDGFEFKAGWSLDLDLSAPEYTEYCYRDAEIAYVAAKALHDRDMDGITMASITWKKVKELFNGSNPRSPAWNSYFPRLTKKLDEFIRPAYMGGINYSDPDFVVPDEGVLLHEDASSMYSTVAVFDELPYGMPVLHSKRPDGLWIARGDFKLTPKPKKPDYLNLPHKTQNEDGTYTLTLTSVDYNLLYDIYDVTYESIETYLGFKSTTNLLKGWFIPWYEEKARAKDAGDKVSETFAKYMLNALTGRFGLRRELTECLLASDWVTIDKQDDEGDDIENDDSYLPYVAFITAHARRRLIQHSKAFKPLVHMDTDSTIGYRQGNMPVSISALGGWNVESAPTAIIEGGFKRYVEIHEDGSYTMAAAGVPQKSDANNVPIGMWIEILDNPHIIKIKGYELGQEHYQVKSQWLRQKLEEGGYDPDNIDTRKLMPKKAFGGYIYVPTTMKLNDALALRWK